MKKNLRILLAEDDKNLGELLKTYMDAKGYVSTLCVNGEDAIQAFNRGSFDFCILDIMMPVKDGFTVAREIRKRDKKIPILFLTAKSMQEDILRGFQMGADDYITKPFNMEVLMSRMNAIIRRTIMPEKSAKSENLYKIGEFTFDNVRQMLSKDNIEHKLTSKESELLKLLCENPNEVLDRRIALKEIWRDDSYFNARSMDVYVTKLRKLVREDPTIELLNVHGTGFKLVGKIEIIKTEE